MTEMSIVDIEFWLVIAWAFGWFMGFWAGKYK